MSAAKRMDGWRVRIEGGHLVAGIVSAEVFPADALELSTAVGSGGRLVVAGRHLGEHRAVRVDRPAYDLEIAMLAGGDLLGRWLVRPEFLATLAGLLRRAASALDAREATT
ncbi:hypothetical protein [Actinoalloteichus hymeniacidonis]|uniref:hypothetical protein n=1 Tax=Actinoalloteichus hymeniacidonis TaxID=340345 RepID=UPI0012F725F7|nr:hypothetical protein [Actinoalloteichus hymeniacidonis]MBB5907754.1 hypothetical protein [Actinoalloteichus hymeniacidonis]